MKFKNKILIFILTVLFSAVSFSSSTFAAEDITGRLKIEPKSIKNSGREWSIDISGQNAKEGDWATFRAENVSIIPGGKVDLNYKGDKIGEILVDKKYSDGHELNYQSAVRNDDNTKPGATIWQGKIVFDKNIEKYTNFEASISNDNINRFSYVDRDVTVEAKIIGSTTLKGEDVKLTKQPLINLSKTTLGQTGSLFNSNNGGSTFEPTILQSRNEPVKSGTRVKITINEDSSVRFDDQKTYQVGKIFWLTKLRESITASTPVNKYGVYFAGGPSMEAKMISLSKTEIVFEITKDMPATDGVYRAFMASIDVVDGSNIRNGKIENIKHNIQLIAPDGSIIDQKNEKISASIIGSNVETYAKIRKPETERQKPAPTPAQPQPAIELPKDEASEAKVQAPNTGFEKSQSLIIPSFSILGLITILFFRKKSKLKL